MGGKWLLGGRKGREGLLISIVGEELRGGEKGANQLLDGGRKGGKGKVLL